MPLNAKRLYDLVSPAVCLRRSRGPTCASPLFKVFTLYTQSKSWNGFTLMAATNIMIQMG